MSVSAASEPHDLRPTPAKCLEPTGNSAVGGVEDSALTCTRFQPWRDSAMIDVTDGQTPPNTIKWLGPYFIAS